MNATTGKEIRAITDDPSYDFNNQKVRYLKKPIKLLPGHRIDVECNYETTDRKNPVVSGLESSDEMCLAFLHIYPRVSLKTCWSYTLVPMNFERIED